VGISSSATASEAVEVARDWRVKHEQGIVDEFVELLAIPNVASDTENIRKNANHISGILKKRDFEVQLLELEGSPPVVFAELPSPGATKTLMIYIHYDGQPVNATDWASDPWTPVLRDAPVEAGGKVIPLIAPFDPESRLFARSAGDVGADACNSIQTSATASIGLRLVPAQTPEYLRQVIEQHMKYTRR